MRTQADEILAHLKRGRCVSTVDAWRLFGTTRLAARVYDLRHKGWDVRTHLVNVRARRGRMARIAVYRLHAD